jgi:hypothetical protein
MQLLQTSASAALHNRNCTYRKDQIVEISNDDRQSFIWEGDSVALWIAIDFSFISYMYKVFQYAQLVGPQRVRYGCIQAPYIEVANLDIVARFKRFQEPSRQH